MTLHYGVEHKHVMAWEKPFNRETLTFSNMYILLKTGVLSMRTFLQTCQLWRNNNVFVGVEGADGRGKTLEIFNTIRFNSLRYKLYVVWRDWSHWRGVLNHLLITVTLKLFVLYQIWHFVLCLYSLFLKNVTSIQFFVIIFFCGSQNKYISLLLMLRQTYDW